MTEEEAKLEADKKNSEIKASDIKKILFRTKNFYEVYIDEYTYGDLRIDGLSVNVHDRTIKGYEIKVSRADFNQDKKWQLYGKFCSSLFLVCPIGLVQPEEIDKPFGLIWVGYEAQELKMWNTPSDWKVVPSYHMKKRAKPLANVNMYNWIFTYMQVLEYEFPRLVGELNTLKGRT